MALSPKSRHLHAAGSSPHPQLSEPRSSWTLSAGSSNDIQHRAASRTDEVSCNGRHPDLVLERDGSVDDLRGHLRNRTRTMRSPLERCRDHGVLLPEAGGRPGAAVEDRDAVPEFVREAIDGIVAVWPARRAISVMCRSTNARSTTSAEPSTRRLARSQPARPRLRRGGPERLAGLTARGTSERRSPATRSRSSFRATGRRGEWRTHRLLGTGRPGPSAECSSSRAPRATASRSSSADEAPMRAALQAPRYARRRGSAQVIQPQRLISCCRQNVPCGEA